MIVIMKLIIVLVKIIAAIIKIIANIIEIIAVAKRPSIIVIEAIGDEVEDVADAAKAVLLITLETEIEIKIIDRIISNYSDTTKKIPMISTKLIILNSY